jgi:nucleoside-diphosphate-sugar epimerase
VKTADVFVTGAGGWLGQNLIEFLAGEGPAKLGLKVQKLTALLAPGEDEAALRAIHPELQIARGDLRLRSSLGDFLADARGGIVIHAAGLIHPRRPHELFAVNRDGTRHLLEQATIAGANRVVVVSSNSPCGCNPHPDHRFDEDSPYRPYLSYGRSKMEMEQAVRRCHEAGDVETVIIRAPWFYGPRQPPRQKLFFEMIRRGKVPIVGSGENLRSMAYVQNLAQGLVLAATHPAAAGQTYWIADERPYSMNEIIGTIERLMEEEFGQTCAHRRVRLPSALSSVAYVFDAILQSLDRYHQKIHVLSEMNKTIACSVAKAQRELGYRPEVSLEEGMRRSLAEIYGSRTDGALTQ